MHLALHAHSWSCTTSAPLVHCYRALPCNAGLLILTDDHSSISEEVPARDAKDGSGPRLFAGLGEGGNEGESADATNMCAPCDSPD